MSNEENTDFPIELILFIKVTTYYDYPDKDVSYKTRIVDNEHHLPWESFDDQNVLTKRSLTKYFSETKSRGVGLGYIEEDEVILVVARSE